MGKNKLVLGFDFSPEINLGRYLQKIRSFPILSPEEEFLLANEYIINKSSAASQKMLTSHLRLVVKIAAQFRGYGLPLAEMIAEGNIGLILALNKFNPQMGCRFSTYAMWWIKACIQKYILSSWSLVKIGTTTAQKKLFFNLKKIKEKLQLLDDTDFSDKIIFEIADYFDVSAQEVINMNERIKNHDGSLNVVLKDDEQGSEWLDFVADKKPNQEEVFSAHEDYSRKKKIFEASLVCLTQREKEILFKRRLQAKANTLENLSLEYAISKERVRQIEFNSIKKIKNFIAQNKA